MLYSLLASYLLHSNSEKTSLPGLYPPEETAVCFFTLRCSSSFTSLLFNSDHCFRIKAPNSVYATHSGSLLDVVVLTRCREPARWSSSARAASSTSPPRSLCACFVGWSHSHKIPPQEATQSSTQTQCKWACVSTKKKRLHDGRGQKGEGEKGRRRRCRRVRKPQAWSGLMDSEVQRGFGYSGFRDKVRFSIRIN